MPSSSSRREYKNAWQRSRTPEQKAKRAAQARARYHKDPEKHRAQANKHRVAHKEEIAARRKEEYASNPDKYRQKRREQYRSDKFGEAAKRAKARADRALVEGSFTAEDVREQFNSQGGKCFYCRMPLAELHLDHKIPLFRGGTNWPANIVCACKRCNLSKGTKTDAEFFLVLWRRRHESD